MKYLLSLSLIFLLLSCEEPNNTDSVLGEWELVEINLLELPETPYDSLFCDGDELKAYKDGIVYPYEDVRVDNSDYGREFTEFSLFDEVWTFNSEDYSIDRDGEEASSLYCEDGNIRSVTFPGFPVFYFSGELSQRGNLLIVYEPNNDSYLKFQIISQSETELILELGDRNINYLRFIKVGSN